CVTEVVVGPRGLRRKRRSNSKVLDSFIESVRVRKGDSEVRLRLGRVGKMADDLLIPGDGVGPIATIGERVGQIEARVFEVRLQSDGLFEMRDRLVKAS